MELGKLPQSGMGRVSCSDVVRDHSHNQGAYCARAFVTLRSEGYSGMISLEAQRQKRYRERKTKRADQMKSALSNILAELAGNDKPLAVKLRAIAEEGLRP